MTDEVILETAKNVYERCNYKDKCFGRLHWCDGTITPICRAIQAQTQTQTQIKIENA